MLYIRYLKGSEYKNLFLLSHILYVISHTLKYFLACRWFKGYGEYPIYFVTGTMAESLEMALKGIPSMIIIAKIIPKGIESSMMTLNSSVIMVLGMMTRIWMGVFINDTFIHVTKKTIKDYKYLCLISAIMSIIPCFIVWYMVPTIAETDERQE